MSVNKVILLGNLCEDPRVRNFDNGGKVAQFSLATNKRPYKKKDGSEVPGRTDFHNVVINVPGLSEIAEKYLKKGNKVYLEGELRTRKYEDENKVIKYITEVYVSSIELLSSKKDDVVPNSVHTKQPENVQQPENYPVDGLPF